MLAADKKGNLSYINSPTSIVSNQQAIISDRHDGAANILFCDGHVSSLTYNEILENHQSILDPFWGWRALPQPSVN
jgi:prepilin-type processing-associated H-X9-DG protein